MKPWKKWLYGLVAGCVGAFAQAFLGSLGIVGLNWAGAKIPQLDLKQAAIVAGTGALISCSHVPQAIPASATRHQRNQHSRRSQPSNTMKFIRRQIDLILLVLFGVVAPMALIPFTGCKHTPEQVMYNVGVTSSITVDTAMTLYDQLVAAGKISLDEERRVKAMHEKFQVADVALLQAAGAVLAARTSGQGVPAAQLAWRQAEAGLSAASGELFRLLASLGVDLNAKPPKP